MTTPTEPPARPVAEQLILDLTSSWSNRYAHAQTLPRGNWFDRDDPANTLWRATAAGITDGWAAIYLLGLLHAHNPDVADKAARYLRSGAMAGDPHGDRLPLYAAQWRRAVEDGRPLLPLLP